MAHGRLAIGMDVGSTTVKAVVVDPATKEILWSDYKRHHTKQPEYVLEMIGSILAAFPDRPADGWKIFLTGSGSGPLCAPTNGKFVQEVNAVTLAVEHLHPDVGSVIELGGQDAKIIVFKGSETSDEKTAIASMNDKCASGTGATIDKCFLKVNAPPELVTSLHFDDSKLHHVAAKCGVFAETDIVNLIKSGIPANEVLCSLADAIVLQNLSVLTRGATLRHRVLLLGGPNTYLPFLQECWRLRIPQTWNERGYAYPKDMPVEELIFVPKNSQYYAALGAVLFGLHEDEAVGILSGTAGLCASTSRTGARRASARAPVRRSRRPPTSSRTSAAPTGSRSSSPPRSSRASTCAASSAWTAGRRRARRCSSTTRAGASWRRPTSSRRATPSRTRRSS